MIQLAKVVCFATFALLLNAQLGALCHADTVMMLKSHTVPEGVVATYRPLIVTSEDPVSAMVGTANNTVPGMTELTINHDGVVQLQLDVIAGNGVGSCTGSLLTTGRHILTAAHCVADGTGNNAVMDIQPNLAIFDLMGGIQTIPFSRNSVQIHPSYDGDVIHGFDVAVIELDFEASASIPRYEFVGPGPSPIIDGAKFGFGRGGHGSVGSTVSASIPGTKRFGQNRYEALGLNFTGSSNHDTMLTYDFDDDGDASRDAFQVHLSFASDTGIGDGDEVNSAQGDSGGPTFISDEGTMKIAGVTSYGLSLGTGSDIDGMLNSSFGEFSADARVANPSINAFIVSAIAVPEPSSFLFFMALLVGNGFFRRLRLSSSVE